MFSKLFNPTQRPILEILLEASYNNPLKRYDLMKEFLTAEIYVRGLKRDSELFLDYNENSLLAFTSRDALRKARQNINDYTYCKVSTILKVMPSGIRLLLNTGPNYGKEFLPGELVFLKDGKVPPDLMQPLHLPPGQKFVVYSPKVYPEKLVDLLFEKIKSRENIEKAYIAEIFLEKNECPNFIIGIKVSNTVNFSHDLAYVAEVVNGVIGPGEYIDFIEITERDISPIGNFMLKETKPFFDRDYISK